MEWLAFLLFIQVGASNIYLDIFIGAFVGSLHELDHYMSFQILSNSQQSCSST